MAVPYVVTSFPITESSTLLPPEARAGDLILVFQGWAYTVDDAGHHHNPPDRTQAILGGIDDHRVISARGAYNEWVSFGSGKAWRRAYVHETYVRGAFVPDNPSDVQVYTPGGGSRRGVVIRDARGIGATSRHTWRVATTDNQALGIFSGSIRYNTPPAGVTEVIQNVWQAPVSGGGAGPGGAIDTTSGGDKQPAPYLFGLEIMGTTAPSTPLLLDPPHQSQVPNGVPVEFSWGHQPSRAGGSQQAYKFQLTHHPADPDADPVVRWWDGTNLVAHEVEIISAESRIELPPSVIGEDQSMSWTVATQEALDGQWSLYAIDSTVQSVEPPTVDVTGPTAPVHNTLRPVVTFDGQPAPGELLIGYQVRIADADGQTVHDSGDLQGSPGQYATPALRTWVNGGEYVPWVRVRQTGGAWSAWESGAPFLVTWDPPLTPEVSAYPAAPGVLVAAQAPGLLSADVERWQGGQWTPVAFSAAGGTVHDVLAPYGQPVSYRARTSNRIADVDIYSDWAESGPVVSRDRFGYLADANDPTRFVRLRQAHARPSQHPRQIETTYGLGDRFGMVDKGPTLGREGSFVVRTDRIEDEDELLDMLHNVPVLTVRRPAEQRYAGAQQPWRDRGRLDIAVTSPIEETPIATDYLLSGRLFTFDWIEQ